LRNLVTGLIVLSTKRYCKVKQDGYFPFYYLTLYLDFEILILITIRVSLLTSPVPHSERQNRSRGNRYTEGRQPSGTYPSRDRR